MFSPQATEILGLAVLAALVLAVAGHAVWSTRHWPLRWSQKPFYFLNYFLCKTLWRARVVGQFPLVGEGGVVVCNHRAPVDPCFLELATARLLHWLVAKEYCDHPASGWFLRLGEVIPVRRGAVDPSTVKQAIEHVRRGGVIGLFPEGRINTTAELLLPCRVGAAMIALKTRAPVVPCYIRNSPYRGFILSPFVTPSRTDLIIGRPIDFSEFHGREDDRDVLVEVTRRFLREIARLAGRPDFEPTVIGRQRTNGLKKDSG